MAFLHDYISDGTLGMVVHEFPPEMETWKKRTTWLLNDFIATGNGKTIKQALADLFHFANGDSEQSTFVHWCLVPSDGKPPCCSSDGECVAKALSHIIPIFCRGYDVPLLYRMKHFGQASSYVKLGCSFFKLLPQALAELQDLKASQDITCWADALLAEGRGFQSLEADYEQLLSEAMDMDQNYAAQNKVRLKKVIEEVGKDRFCEGSMVIDALIKPVETGINTLLSHTKVYHDLAFLGHGHPHCKDLRDAASKKFLDAVSGRLGDSLVGHYCRFLQTGLKEAIDMGLNARPELLSQVFQLATLCMTDLHRRFKYEFRSPPYCLFGLIGLNLSDFVCQWSALQDQHRHCDECLDAEFSEVLVQHFKDDIRLRTLPEQEAVRQEVQGLLRDISEWAPLTSDTVELKHGTVQWSVSKRGSQSVKNPRTAAETTLLQAAVKQSCWCQASAAAQTLPRKAVSSGIQKMVGTSSRNQHSQQDREFSQPFPLC